jgi:ferredoxin
MPKVTFVKEKQDVEVPAGAILRDEAIKAGTQVNFHMGNAFLGRFLHCRGHGLCGTCHVLVKKGMENLSPKIGKEKIKLGLMMGTIGREEESRLACQVKVNGDCTVETNPGLNLYGENFWQKPYPNK